MEIFVNPIQKLDRERDGWRTRLREWRFERLDARRHSDSNELDSFYASIPRSSEWRDARRTSLYSSTQSSTQSSTIPHAFTNHRISGVMQTLALCIFEHGIGRHGAGLFFQYDAPNRGLTRVPSRPLSFATNIIHTRAPLLHLPFGRLRACSSVLTRRRADRPSRSAHRRRCEI